MVQQDFAIFGHRMRQAIALLTLCILWLLVSAWMTQAIANGTELRRHIANPHARARIELMNEQKAAIALLRDMAAGRIMFDPKRARTARRSLVSTTGKIPKVFRRPGQDPNAHARTVVWQNWDGFATEAKRAKQAARQLRTGDLGALRRSLPPLMQTCISCHRDFRDAPNDAVTH